MRDLFGEAIGIQGHETPRRRGAGTRAGEDRRIASPRPRPVGRPGRLRLCDDVAVNLAGTCLFYPCSWWDLRGPLLGFTPYVSSFWFADTGYSEDRSDLGRILRPGYRVAGGTRVEPIQLAGDESTTLLRRGRRPFVTHCQVHCENEAKDIDVRLCGADGPALFRSIQERIGVFFYRGDGDGDGGLRGIEGQLPYVLDRLVDGGLIVTDGCNQFGGEEAELPYWELGRFCYTQTNVLRAFRDARDISDAAGRRFRCVGFVEHDDFGKGPTLVWQVTRS